MPDQSKVPVPEVVVEDEDIADETEDVEPSLDPFCDPESGTHLLARRGYGRLRGYRVYPPSTSLVVRGVTPVRRFGKDGYVWGPTGTSGRP